MAPAGLSGDVEGDPSEDAERERVRTENEELRAQNLRLRAAVSAARPETPEPLVHPSTPAAGGALEAADRLVHLMREGGHLLKEREALLAENQALESELEALVAEEGAADGAPPPEAAAEVAEGAEDESVSVVERLVPLLSEGDALRTEREGLRAERKELIMELEAMGAHAGKDEAGEDLSSGDKELEGRFLGAVEDVSRENASLEAEIKKLREENTRLRRKNSAPAKDEPVKPQKTAPSPVATKTKSLRPVTPSAQAAGKDIDIGIDFDQRQAMASLLRKTKDVVSPSATRSPGNTRDISPSRRAPLDVGQEEQLKGALHTLFRNFGR